MTPPDTVFRYLAQPRALPVSSPADAVIGFGHFDLRIADTCARIFAEGRARRILLTGGVGAGTADLGGPEAEVLGARVLSHLPELAPADLIRETRSTNTGENVLFLRDLLAGLNPPLILGREIRSVILVATPARMRRVRLTYERWVPDVPLACEPPASSCATDTALFASKGQDYLGQLLGELRRLQDYADKGYIVSEPIPEQVLVAARSFGF